MSGRQTPSEFLKQLIGKPVMVKLNSGLDYRGILACLDGYLNVALEQTEEYANGQLKQKYGDAFIRGNNVFWKIVSHIHRQRQMVALPKISRSLWFRSTGWSPVASRSIKATLTIAPL
ncbi:U6 snRNA-associated Sm-like protein LSm6 [Trichinella sp. T8]|nr:U6 snRNA-associated Sm-like protein LSm6 [Trichinella sp. T8]